MAQFLLRVRLENVIAARRCSAHARLPYHGIEMTDRELIRHIERSAGQRAGYKQLVREFSLGGGRERRLLLEHLARLTAARAPHEDRSRYVGHCEGGFEGRRP